MQTVVETEDYLADTKDAGVTIGEREAIIKYIAANPEAGDLIVGTGGARKIRFRGRGKGKSGGYRIITYYGGADLPVFLLNMFAKGDRVDLSQNERNELRAELAGLAEDYRKGVLQYVRRR